MPPTVVAGNWKMNTNVEEARVLAGDVARLAASAVGVEIILCPPAVSLVTVRDAVSGSAVTVGAQNMYFQDSGAYTGEISPAMLADVCQYVILGHSERRQLFGENDQLVNLKVKAALNHGLKPILCVGETLEQRESGSAAEVISSQVRAGLADISESDISGLVVAYEPVWAIGTGQAATPEIAAEIMGGPILDTLNSLFGSTSEDIPLLNGGSVNADNVYSFASQPCIHGALVGGASLQAQSFVDIARQAAEAKGVAN